MPWEENYQEKKINLIHLIEISVSMRHLEKHVWQLDTNVEREWLKHKVFSQANIHRNNFCFHSRCNNWDQIYLPVLNYYKARQNIWNINFHTFNNSQSKSKGRQMRWTPTSVPDGCLEFPGCSTGKGVQTEHGDFPGVDEIGPRIYLARILRIKY